MEDRQNVLLGNGDRAIVEPWDEASAYRLENLICVDSQGSMRWRAQLPKGSGADCFVAIRADGGELTATTWSGWRIEVEPSTGRHLRAAFVK